MVMEDVGVLKGKEEDDGVTERDRIKEVDGGGGAPGELSGAVAIVVDAGAGGTRVEESRTVLLTGTGAATDAVVAGTNSL